MLAREAMLGATWGGRGSAKAAGTHDMLIPGVVTAVRQHPRPIKKPQQTKLQANVLQQGVQKRRTRSSSHHRGSPSASSDNEERRTNEKQHQDERQRKKEEDERQQRKEIEAAWRQAQAEREAKQLEDARYAEEQRKREEERDQARKRNLKGAFAVSGELDEDERENLERARELAAQKRRATESGCSAAIPAIVAPLPQLPVLSARSEPPRLGEGENALTLRASLADPSATRMCSPGEVAETYRLLQEMKRKFRRADFGGPVAPKRRGGRSRSVSRRRSHSRSRYDSVWIRPTSRRTGA